MCWTKRSIVLVICALAAVNAMISPCICPSDLPMRRRSTQCSFSTNVTDCELHPHKLVKRSVNNPLRVDLEVFDEGRCNSDKLQRIMKENMYGDYRDAKMRIMQYAEDSIGGHFGVVCAPGEFSYVTKTRLFCLYSTLDATCFVFLTEHELPIN